MLFKDRMSLELEKNSYKGTGVFTEDQIPMLITDCLYHISKLSQALKDKDIEKIKEFSADSANYMEFIYNIYNDNRVD